MLYDYVEIGTSDFETCLDKKLPYETALLVEPLFSYLANLPEKPNTVMAPFAVSNFTGYDRMFYVTEENIKLHCLPRWVRGCNSFQKPHPTIGERFPNVPFEYKLIPVICVADLLSIYSIKTIKHLKIDTEGHDHIILRQFEIYLDKLEVETIQFEYISFFENIDRLDDFIKCSKKFKVVDNDGDNVYMERITW